ncbi:DUF1285 domain-containing protein [Acinetobacter rathckeae]|uniref:DUF1285 domain-containing protein n=1 Tax=Acinetobacter rathckeae TaxID=2605272 RepID=UPI0018A28CA4|nr:DUF1285 domain-containing protein [Acinetobacter rathckeae]MBF7687849.1 DUF1285 domain-containing protein [Acinetobacter rathckeae]MBF7687928.1 DUF1285 domain-containing protein [Acinetobacter rathckeae]
MVNDEICPDLCKKNTHMANKLVQIAEHAPNLGAILAHTDIPPLHTWQPKYCGEMDLCIRADGTWWHEGQQMQREALVRQFSRILCKEDSTYFLKTPVEKIAIDVQDAPLQIARVEQVEHDHQSFLYFYTTDGDCVLLDAKHAVFMKNYDGQDRPYIWVRYSLHACIPRAVFLHLVDYGELQQKQNDETVLLLQSGDFCLHLTA